jgi:hypothetical protein
MTDPLKIPKISGQNRPNVWTGQKNGIKYPITILQKPRLNGLKVEN